jgi:hypothetical protein
VTESGVYRLKILPTKLNEAYTRRYFQLPNGLGASKENDPYLTQSMPDLNLPTYFFLGSYDPLPLQTSRDDIECRKVRYHR